MVLAYHSYMITAIVKTHRDKRGHLSHRPYIVSRVVVAPHSQGQSLKEHIKCMVTLYIVSLVLMKEQNPNEYS
jgi:hypothetical protein